MWVVEVQHENELEGSGVDRVNRYCEKAGLNAVSNFAEHSGDDGGVLVGGSW